MENLRNLLSILCLFYIYLLVPCSKMTQIGLSSIYAEPFSTRIYTGRKTAMHDAETHYNLYAHAHFIDLHRTKETELVETTKYPQRICKEKTSIAKSQTKAGNMPTM